jgi:hypothetical protein
MSEPLETGSREREGPLAATIREVKNALADRDDVVVDIREAQLTRLEMLADELKPVFAEVPVEDDWFDLVISSGAQPRLWIDAVAHVTMARDRRTYRFLHDTRLGRVVLAESSDMKPVADQVTRYIAERMVERRRAMEGDPIPLERMPAGAEAPMPAAGLATGLSGETEAAKPEKSSFLTALLVVVAGALVGVAAILALSGDWAGRFAL